MVVESRTLEVCKKKTSGTLFGPAAEHRYNIGLPPQMQDLSVRRIGTRRGAHTEQKSRNVLRVTGIVVVLAVGDKIQYSSTVL